MIAGYLVRLGLPKSVPVEELPSCSGRDVAVELCGDIIGLHQNSLGRDIMWSRLCGPAGIYHGRRYAFAGVHWLRLTVLKPEMFAKVNNALTRAVANRTTVAVNRTKLHVIETVSDAAESPWAAISSYERLLSKAGDERSLAFAFRSLVFSNEKDGPMAVSPSQIFGQCYQAWQKHAAPAGEEKLLARLSECAQVRSQKLKGSSARLPDGTRKLTVSGHMRIFLQTDDSYTVRLANALADYSLFCGTFGDHELGMGMTRRLRGIQCEN